MLRASTRLGICAALCVVTACGSETERTVTAPDPIEPGATDAGHEHDAKPPVVLPPTPPPPVVDAGPTRDPEACRKLPVLVRDFNASHPDFERYTSDFEYRGLVADVLGDDKTPTYLPTGGTPVTTGPSEFAQWYHDVPGINIAVPVDLMLVEQSPGLYVYDSKAFFPVDGAGFNEQTQGHNFSFTTEIHTSFTYQGGERFTFIGDDDLWLFINGKLAIDLGGTHPELRGTVDLDAQAAQFSIEKGKEYRMDIFHAERHTPGSNFHIETSIECFVPVVVI